MMAQGVQRMDAGFRAGARCGAACRAIHRSTCRRRRRCRNCRWRSATARPTATANAFQVQVSGKDVNMYNFAMAHLRTLAGIELRDAATDQPGGHELRAGRLSLAVFSSSPRRSTRVVGSLRRRARSSGSGLDPASRPRSRRRRHRPSRSQGPAQPQPATPAQPQPVTNQVTGRQE